MTQYSPFIAIAAAAVILFVCVGLTLLGGDLGTLVRARRLSKAVMRNIRQNLVFAFLIVLANLCVDISYPFLDRRIKY